MKNIVDEITLEVIALSGIVTHGTAQELLSGPAGAHFIENFYVDTCHRRYLYTAPTALCLTAWGLWDDLCGRYGMLTLDDAVAQSSRVGVQYGAE